MNNELFICSATKGKKEDTLLWQTKDHSLEVFFKEGNKDSLQQVYNKAIDFAIKENLDHIVLCHDDIILENFDYEKLKTHFETYDVLGVAGASQIKIQEPALWHLMGGGFQGGNLHGAVAHLNKGKKSMTAFGPYPHQALIMDGVFLAISRKAFKKIRFAEDCPAGFHFYDLAYTLDASLAGLKCGVIDAYITHASPGLREYTDDWKAGQAWFFERYADYADKIVRV
jgi:GT2 family glycosyltransferase